MHQNEYTFSKNSPGMATPGPPLTAGTQPVRQRRTGRGEQRGSGGRGRDGCPGMPLEIVGHPTHEDEENGISPSMIAVMMAEIR